jgi:hypothetical protein
MSNANRFVDGALGGWQLQDITVWRSGLPFTPTISKDQANTGVGSQRPIRIGSGKLAHPTLADWFDKTAFTVPAQYTYGNTLAYILEGDLYRQDDASIFKSFHISETSKVEFRAEFFNLANITSFNPPSTTTVDTSSGGIVTATSTNPRQIQFALKYYF